MGYTYNVTDPAGDAIIADTNVSETSAIISHPNIIPGTSYTFSVAGRTSAGIGEYGNLVIYVESKLLNVMYINVHPRFFSNNYFKRNTLQICVILDTQVCWLLKKKSKEPKNNLYSEVSKKLRIRSRQHKLTDFCLILWMSKSRLHAQKTLFEKIGSDSNINLICLSESWLSASVKFHWDNRLSKLRRAPK